MDWHISIGILGLLFIGAGLYVLFFKNVQVTVKLKEGETPKGQADDPLNILDEYERRKRRKAGKD